MAVDLADYVGTLKRQVIPPGSTLFAGVPGSAWTAYLTDAFWESRLDGFLEGYTIQNDTEVVSADGGEDIGLEYVALIALYAGITILRNQILNTKTQFRAKAGPVEFEQQTSATTLAEMLKQLRATKERVIEQMEFDSTDTLYLDAYSTRLFSPVSYWGAPELMG